MSIHINIVGGTSKRLLTAGKYCDRDIVVTAEGSGIVGSLSEYARVVATPSSNISFVINNPLGGLARKVTVQRKSDVATSSRKVQKYVADADLGIGVVELLDTSGKTRYTVSMATSGVGNGEFAITDGKITLYRFNASNTWSTTDEYEVEIYQ